MIEAYRMGIFLMAREEVLLIERSTGECELGEDLSEESARGRRDEYDSGPSSGSGSSSPAEEIRGKRNLCMLTETGSV